MKIARMALSSLLMVVPPLSALAQTPSGPSTNGASSSAPAGALHTTADYRLVAGDKLRIEVYKDPQLSQSLQIRPDGKITLPLIGDVQAAGATPRELTDTLTERLRDYITAPAVTVIVAEAVPPLIYVMGEVRTPGAQPMPVPISVMQALAVAGGFKDFANPKKIRILRKGPDTKLQTIEFNYKEAVDRADPPLLLQPGDTVIVP
jgi:polysaccharide export outer membrane protein